MLAYIAFDEFFTTFFSMLNQIIITPPIEEII